jgi:hypothetical protein
MKDTNWKNNIKMVLREIGCEGVNWIHLAQDRVNTKMNILGSTKWGEFLV